jgi:hypothetical protein
MQEMNRVLMRITQMKLFLEDVSFILVAHAVSLFYVISFNHLF